jgi:predicted dehydrogenase
MERVGVGVIGCGIGKWHLEGFSQDPRADIVAIAGLDFDRCNQNAEIHRVPNVYADYHQLLERADITAISVAVPNFLHAQIGLDAIAAGKHVLMEKPLARNEEEGATLVRAAQDAGLVLGILFNRRARADMEVLKAHIEQGGLGNVYHAKAFWRRRSGIPGLGSWFTSKELAGGGPLIDLGVHVLDMVLWQMGNPEIATVSASTYAELGPQGIGHWQGNRFAVETTSNYDVEDLAVAYMRTTAGASIFLEASWAAHSGDTDEFGIYLLGDKGGAELHVKDYATVDTLRLFGNINGIPVDTTARLPQKAPGAGHAQIVSAFLDSIIAGVPMSPSGEEGLERTRILDAIYQSAEEGRELSLVPAALASQGA